MWIGINCSKARLPFWLFRMSRCATEQGTRDAFGTSFLDGYGNSLGNMHGWADGDDFQNYIGHPMEGAVTGYIWQHNDRAYRDVVFGKNAIGKPNSAAPPLPTCLACNLRLAP